MLLQGEVQLRRRVTTGAGGVRERLVAVRDRGPDLGVRGGDLGGALLAPLQVQPGAGTGSDHEHGDHGQDDGATHVLPPT